jgi:hypothetical protein
MTQKQTSHLEDSVGAIELSSYLVSFLDSAWHFQASKGTTTACEEFRSWHALRGPSGHSVLGAVQAEGDNR